jgi:hypothetical protein
MLFCCILVLSYFHQLATAGWVVKHSYQSADCSGGVTAVQGTVAGVCGVFVGDNSKYACQNGSLNDELFILFFSGFLYFRLDRCDHTNFLPQHADRLVSV